MAAKNILLPGGIGYIGSHVIVQILKHTPHRITILDNYYNSHQDVIGRIFQAIAADGATQEDLQAYKSRIYFKQGNILDLQFVKQAFKAQRDMGHPLTTVIHFAAKKSAPESVLFPLQYFENNFQGTLNLLKVMGKNAECREFIFSSTAAIYGEQDNCTELFDCQPITPYGESKLCVQMMLKSVAKVNPWKVITLRYFNPGGNHPSGKIGDDPALGFPSNLFPVIQEVIMGKRESVTIFGDDYKTHDGTGVRDFIHVVDLASGHLKALQFIDSMNERSYEVFNLGCGQGCSVLEVVNAFNRVLDDKIKYKMGPRREGDIQKLVAIPKKAQKILKWKAERSLEEMCRSCVAFTLKLKERDDKLKSIGK